MDSGHSFCQSPNEVTESANEMILGKNRKDVSRMSLRSFDKRRRQYSTVTRKKRQKYPEVSRLESLLDASIQSRELITIQSTTKTTNVSFQSEIIEIQAKKSRPSEKRIDGVVCAICGIDIIYVFRYQIYMCRACFNYFRRNHIHMNKFKCDGTGNCEIGPDIESNCNKCQINKYINAGMEINLKECVICDRVYMHKFNNIDSCRYCSNFLVKHKKNKINPNYECVNNNECIINKTIIRNCKKCLLNKINNVFHESNKSAKTYYSV